jgi:hypothetical protein
MKNEPYHGSTLHIVIIGILAILGNLFIRHFLKKLDNKPMTQEHPRMDVEQLKIQPAEVLRVWGKEDHQPIKVAGPVHPKIFDILKQYGTVGPDKYFLPIDRQFIEVPYEENQKFLQIGTWGDGSPIVVKRDATDPFVYLADLDDTGSDSPVIIANTIEDFLKGIWAYDNDSLKWK